MWWRSFPMEMKVKPLSRNSFTRSVPNKNKPRITLFGTDRVKEFLHSICAKQEQAKNNI